MLKLHFQRTTLAIAGHQPDSHERQKEDGRQLARAERRRPDTDERRKRFTDPRCGTIEAAGLRVSAYGTDERESHERSHQEQEYPPCPRGPQFAPLFAEQPPPARAT